MQTNEPEYLDHQCSSEEKEYIQHGEAHVAVDDPVALQATQTQQRGMFMW